MSCANVLDCENPSTEEKPHKKLTEQGTEIQLNFSGDLLIRVNIMSGEDTSCEQ